MCFLASLQSSMIALFAEKDLTSWKLITHLEIASCLYAVSSFLFFYDCFQIVIASNLGHRPFFFFLKGNWTGCVFLCPSLGNFSERSPLLCNVQSSMHSYCWHFFCCSSTWGDIRWKVISFPPNNFIMFNFCDTEPGCHILLSKKVIFSFVYTLQFDWCFSCDNWFVCCAMG